jgi:hypothetical protein
MAVTVITPNAKEQQVPAQPGTCREVVRSLGIVSDRTEIRIFDVERVDVSDRPFRDFEGRRLTVAPKEIIGG